jgi:hypothetical protein
MIGDAFGFKALVHAHQKRPSFGNQTMVLIFYIVIEFDASAGYFSDFRINRQYIRIIGGKFVIDLLAADHKKYSLVCQLLKRRSPLGHIFGARLFQEFEVLRVVNHASAIRMMIINLKLHAIFLRRPELSDCRSC